jgi:hypothetical protein
MRTLKSPVPAANTLFDLDALAWWTKLSPNALRALRSNWQGVFHQTILGLMQKAAEALGEHFSEDLGRPTKELYALSGLLLIAEFKNWTIDEAAEAWTLDAGVQFALHLPRDRQYLCARTLDNYRRLLRENVDVQEIFMIVTAALVMELELDIRRQRLDSTHLLSHMAQMGRTQLLAVSVRRFLVQLKKRELAAYEALPEEMRERYQREETRLFGWGTNQAQPSKEEVLKQVAEDLAFLVERFGKGTEVTKWASYLALSRLFAEHCEVKESKVVVRARSVDANGGSVNCLQNPSDLEAGYSKHKGPGYQVQIAQALPPQGADGKPEGPGLITACVPQSAAVRDNEALAEVMEQQASAQLAPKEMLADTTYGSDANVCACAAAGINLISPVGGIQPNANQPAKHWASRAEQASKARLQKRREEEKTAEWKDKYRLRSGIEGLHHALDVVTGFKQLRVRGGRAVISSILLKVTGWNILAASKIQKGRSRRAAAAAKAAVGSPKEVSARVLRRRHTSRQRFPGRAAPFFTQQAL